MQFYTVVIECQRLVSVFDAKGNKVSDKNVPVKQTIVDLPWATAQAYKKKTPNCEIVAQEITNERNFTSRKKSSVQFGDTYRAPAKSKPKPKQSAVNPATNNNAAMTGDLSAAINARSN